MTSTVKPLRSFLLIAIIVGCGSDAQRPTLVKGSLACRIVATPNDHASLVSAAKTQSGRFVTRNGETIGEWVPIADGSLASTAIPKIQNAVTRLHNDKGEILVAYSNEDITEADIDGVYEGAVDMHGLPALTLTLTDAGSGHFFKFTVDNADHFVAIIADGEVRSVPQILSPIIEQFIIASPTQAESSRLATALTGQ